MARLFSGSQAIHVDSAPVIAAPFSVSVWIRPDVVTTDDFWFLGDKDVSNQHWFFGMTSSALIFRAREAGSSGTATTTAGPSVDVHHHACAVEAAADDRRVFLDGANKGTNTSSRTPTGADRITLGRRDDSSPSNEFNGDIGHAALWDAALTDGEVASLAVGVSPLRVRCNALVYYAPFNGQSPEYDIIGQLSLTVTGAPSVSEEPPIPHSIVAPG